MMGEKKSYIVGQEIDQELPVLTNNKSAARGIGYDKYFAGRNKTDITYEEEVILTMKANVRNAANLLQIEDLGLPNIIGHTMAGGMIKDELHTGWLYDDRWPIDFNMLTSTFRRQFVSTANRTIVQRTLE